MAGKYKWEESPNSTEKNPQWILWTKLGYLTVIWTTPSDDEKYWLYGVFDGYQRVVLPLYTKEEVVKAQRHAVELARAYATSIQEECDRVEFEDGG